MLALVVALVVAWTVALVVALVVAWTVAFESFSYQQLKEPLGYVHHSFSHNVRSLDEFWY